jgi:hypothetical protein
MTMLFAIFGALLAACGAGLAALGIVMLAGGNGPGIVGVFAGVPLCYAAYLFARAAVRERRELREHPPDARQRRLRQAKVRFLLVYATALIVGVFVLPLPGAVRFLMVVAALLLVPLVLAREFEPAKKNRKSRG